MARKADLSAASHSDRKPLLSSEASHSNATARVRARPASHREQSSESRVRHSLAPSDDRRSARMRAPDRLRLQETMRCASRRASRGGARAQRRPAANSVASKKSGSCWDGGAVPPPSLRPPPRRANAPGARASGANTRPPPNPGSALRAAPSERRGESRSPRRTSSRRRSSSRRSRPGAPPSWHTPGKRPGMRDRGGATKSSRVAPGCRPVRRRNLPNWCGANSAILVSVARVSAPALTSAR